MLEIIKVVFLSNRSDIILGAVCDRKGTICPRKNTVLPNNIVIKKCFREITDQIAFLFKDANYQHEQELRIMYWYNEISSDFKHVSMEYPKLFVSPKIHIGIKEIILGPKVRDIQTKVPYLQEELEN